MNSQDINLICSLITRNYCKVIFVSKYLFRLVRTNDKYLQLVHDCIENDYLCDFDELQSILTFKYFINLYDELANLNHKFSNNIFYRLHDTCYYLRFLDLEIIKELVRIRVLNMKNLAIDFYSNDEEIFKLIKYLVISDIYSKNKVILEICRHNNLPLLKFLVEETNIKLTYNNSVIFCYSVFNKELFKYIVSKIPKTDIDYRKLLSSSQNSFSLWQFRYLVEEGYLDIDYDIIKTITLKNRLSFIKYIVEKRHIDIDFNLFCEAIKSNCTTVVKYLHKKFKFDISQVKDELIEYILSEIDNEIYDPYSSDDDTPPLSNSIMINGEEIFESDKRHDILIFLTKND